MFEEQSFSFKKLFIPLTTFKAIRIFAVVGFAVFFNSLFNNFVWDDLVFIAQNPQVHNFNIAEIFGSNTFNSAGFYRPITALYFSSVYRFFGDYTFFYHLVQVSLHILNACLLFYLFKKYLNDMIALFLSLIFLVHPINVESVVFIAGTNIELYFLFGILAVLLVIGNKTKTKNKLLISGLLLLSLLTKEAGLIFFPIILLYQYLFGQEEIVHLSGKEIASSEKTFSLGKILSNLSKIRLTFIYLSLSFLIYIFVRFFIVKIYFNNNDIAPIAHLTLAERIVSIPKIIFYYLSTLIYPSILAIDQLWVVTVKTFNSFYLPLLLDFVFLLIIYWGAFVCFKHDRKFFKVYLVFFAWFVMGLFLALQILPLDMTVADRWFYFPLAGLLGMSGLVFQSFNFNRKILNRLGFVMIIVIALLSVRTIIRNADWYSETTLYSHDIKYEDNFQSENNLAKVLSLEGKYPEAINALEKSVALYPYETNLRNLAYAYNYTGQKERAVLTYYQALKARSFVLPPHVHQSNTYEELAKIQLLFGNYSESRRIAQTGIKDYQDSGYLWYLLALSEYSLKKKDAALSAALKAKELSPNEFTNKLYMKISENAEFNIKEAL